MGILGMYGVGSRGESCDLEPSSVTKDRAMGLSLHSPGPACVLPRDTCPVPQEFLPIMEAEAGGSSCLRPASAT